MHSFDPFNLTLNKMRSSRSKPVAHHLMLPQKIVFSLSETQDPVKHLW